MGIQGLYKKPPLLFFQDKASGFIYLVKVKVFKTNIFVELNFKCNPSIDVIFRPSTSSAKRGTVKARSLLCFYNSNVFYAFLFSACFNRLGIQECTLKLNLLLKGK